MFVLSRPLSRTEEATCAYDGCDEEANQAPRVKSSDTTRRHIRLSLGGVGSEAGDLLRREGMLNLDKSRGHP